jgi:hypothetical protein
MRKALANIANKIWELVQYWFYKAIDYRFRKRSIFWWGIKYFSISLLAELICIQTETQFSYLFTWVNQNWGATWAVVCRTLVDLFLAGGLGYSCITITIKLYLISLFSVLEWKRDNDLTFNWNWKWIWFWKWNWKIFMDFSTTYAIHNHYHGGVRIDKKRIEELSNSHSAESLGIKYIPTLNIPTEAEKEILKSINKTKADKFSELNEGWAKVLEAIRLSKSEINRVININNFEPRLSLNDQSQELSEINSLIRNLDAVLVIAVINQTNISRAIASLNLTELPTIPSDVFELRERIESGTFSLFGHDIEDQEILEIVRKNSRRLIESIRSTRSRIFQFLTIYGELFQNTFLIHSIAGIGKTFFTGSLFDSLKKSGHYPILLKATEFNGPDTNLITKLKEALDLQGSVSIEEIFNEFSTQMGDSKIVLIVDGLNETISTTYSFSPIWKDGLQRLVNLFKATTNLALVMTCRTSYLPHINTKGLDLHSLKGFTDVDTIKEALVKYFDYYKIKANLEEANLDFFSLPLIVGIYCITKNPNRQNVVQVDLSYHSYEQILDAFILSRAALMADTLQMPTSTPVLNGIRRNSILYMLEKSATLTYDDFLTATDGKNIDEILKPSSIGVKLVDEELVFLKEMSPESGELIIHTFQNIGGYLIAKAIASKFPTAMMLLRSSYFNEYLKTDKSKKDEDYHQLYLDIIKFLVIIYSKNNDDLIVHSRDPEIVNSTWDLLFEIDSEDKQNDLFQKLNPLLSTQNGWNSLLEKAIPNMVKKDSAFNFNFIKHHLLKLDSLHIDLAWTRFIYSRYEVFEDFVEYSKEKRREGEEESISELELELMIWLLETTIHELRDKVTKELMEWGYKYPKRMFDKLYEYAQTNQIYIYEKLASICYGICLRKQNDSDFVKNILAPNAPRIYNLQFAGNSQQSSYNYHIIDSFKHLIDLAILKEVFELADEDKRKLKAYKFTLPKDWNIATEDDKESVKRIAVDSYYADGPDPLRMDFVIYTISRLIIRDLEDGGERKLNAVANIYRRILDLGYRTLEFEDRHSSESRFFYGASIPEIDGKIDRLGKKYSWMAYFDYAGYLLSKGELDVWYPDGDGPNGEYQRLSDVRVEVSNTHPPDEEQHRLYNYPMFGERGKKKDWANQTLYHTTKNLWKQNFDNQEFTLINGKVEEKVGESYNTRTYMMIEAYLVKKDDIEGHEHLIVGREFDWNNDIHFNITQSKTYFGELYWADNVSDIDSYLEHLPLEETEEVEVRLTLLDVMSDEKYRDKQSGDIVIEERNKQIQIEVEPATIEFLWESESSVFPTLSRDIPSPNIGRSLSLRADTEGFTFLDDQNKVATKYFDFDDGLIDQDFTYLRTDLLTKYLEERGFELMYQIKQHSYENVQDPENGSNFRGMQFFFPHLLKKA